MAIYVEKISLLEREKVEAESRCQSLVNDLDTLKIRFESEKSIKESEDQSEMSALKSELSNLKSEFQQKEEMIKKLTIKLKAKMKESNDLTASIEKIKEDNVKMSQESKQSMVSLEELQEKLKTELHGKLNEKEDEIEKLRQAKQELEVKVKTLNEMLLNHEDRLSSFVMEKNKLRDDYCKLEQENDVFRQRCYSNEAQMQTLQADYQQKVSQFHEAHEGLMKLEQLHKVVVQDHERLKQEHDHMAKQLHQLQENELKLIEVNVLSRKQSEEIELLKQQVVKEKQEMQNKEDQANDKIKKLKALLNKVNTLSQEKDQKIASMESQSKRPRRFAILSRVNVQYDCASSKSRREEVWNFILPDAPPDTSSLESQTSAKTRWIDSTSLEEWLSQGSSLIGSMPDTLDSVLRMKYESELEKLSNEKSALQAEYDDITQQFQTYKIRAQTALKRVNNEDRERQKQKEMENQEIEHLKEMIEEYIRREEDCKRLNAGLQRQLQESVESLEVMKTMLDHKKQHLEIVEKKIDDQNNVIRELLRLREDWQTEKSRLEDELKKKEILYEQMMLHNNNRQAAPVISQNLSNGTTVAATPSLPSADSSILFPEKSVLVSEITEDDLMMEVAIHTPEKGRSPSGSVHFEKTPKSMLPPSSLSSTVLDKIAVDEKSQHQESREVSSRQLVSSELISNDSIVESGNDSLMMALINNPSSNNGSKLMIFQQADHILKESLQVLREENSNLMSELLELRNDLGLREEQVKLCLFVWIESFCDIFIFLSID
jgi:hypothetical protein